MSFLGNYTLDMFSNSSGATKVDDSLLRIVHAAVPEGCMDYRWYVQGYDTGFTEVTIYYRESEESRKQRVDMIVMKNGDGYDVVWMQEVDATAAVSEPERDAVVRQYIDSVLND